MKSIQFFPVLPHAKRIVQHAGVSLVIVLLLFTSVFAAAPPLNTNLLINPDAETNSTAGWVCPDRPWVAAAEVAPHGGSKFFWPGRGDVADSSMYQDIDVSAHASSIDAGSFYMHLSGWLADWNQPPHDRATLSLQALDANGTSLGYFSAEHRSPAWAQYRIDKPIPAGTRTLRTILRATRFVGTDDDGYFDDLSLQINNVQGATVNITSSNSQHHVTIGNTLALNATTLGDTDSGYVWSSSYQSAATVNQNGVVSGVASGRTTIQARGADSGVIGTFDVTVIPANGLVFVEPASDRTLLGGVTYPVNWSVIGTVTTADLYLSTDGGVHYTLVANIPDASTGVYQWFAPVLTNDVHNAVLKFTYTGGESISPLFNIVTGNLDVVIQGNGSVHSTTPGLSPAISCPGTCTGSYIPGTSITLSATSTWYSRFSGWSGSCGTSPDCTVTLNYPTMITANFSNNQNVALYNTIAPAAAYEASKIQDAYDFIAINQVIDGTIKPQIFTYFENLVFSSPINIHLYGGWNAMYDNIPQGLTTVSGSLKISNGMAVIQNIRIK